MTGSRRSWPSRVGVALAVAGLVGGGLVGCGVPRPIVDPSARGQADSLAAAQEPGAGSGSGYGASLESAGATAEGRALVHLVNLGARSDRYELRVVPPLNGIVSPRVVLLEPGGQTMVQVSSTSDVTVVARSLGGGADVADLLVRRDGRPTDRHGDGR